ncbi:MAG: hypothetical protein OXI23_18270, partial [Gemmatimonadota bacterium]|nr:hypothetical protein [Gemmatimonadota bacterium]
YVLVTALALPLLAAGVLLYTRGLLNSIPQVGQKRRLVPIEGTIPDPFEIPQGCAFAPRCPHAMDKCREEPQLLEIESGHRVSCWLEN